MKISRIKVQNFRSIRSAEVVCVDFNVFVGQNNVGKTNLFEAIEWFYNGTPQRTSVDDLRYKRDPVNRILVEVEFVGGQHGAENMLNDGNRTKMLGVLDGSDTIVVRRTCEDVKRTIEVNGQLVERLPTGFDKAFNDFLPKFEYVHTKQYFDEVAKYSKKAPVGIMLSAVLEEILDENDKYREFRAKFVDLFEGEDSEVRAQFVELGSSVKVHLEKQFSECTSVRFEVKTPEFEDLLKNFETVVDDGVETYASEKGDGMQRALMLAIIQAYADHRKAREDAGKSFLFFSDEAELHLHPTAQRRLKEVLLEISAELDQVFVNTHSSVLVADDHESQKIVRVEKNEGETSFVDIDSSDKPYVVYELLGGSPADLLLPRNFLIVEGASEIELIRAVIRRFYAGHKAIQVVPAEGDTHQANRTINSIKVAYKALQHTIYDERLVVLCDAPSAQAQPGFEEFRCSNGTLVARGQIKVLPVGSLEEYYPARDGWRRTAAQVSAMSGKQKTKLAKRVGSEITQAEFEQEMPVVFQALEQAWASAY